MSRESHNVWEVHAKGYNVSGEVHTISRDVQTMSWEVHNVSREVQTVSRERDNVSREVSKVVEAMLRTTLCLHSKAR